MTLSYNEITRLISPRLASLENTRNKKTETNVTSLDTTPKINETSPQTTPLQIDDLVGKTTSLLEDRHIRNQNLQVNPKNVPLHLHSKMKFANKKPKKK